MSDSTEPGPAPARVWPAWVPLLLLLGYAVFIGVNFAPIASAADAAGYLSSAKLLSEGRLTMPVRTVPEYNPPNGWGYHPLGFDESRQPGQLRPTYPVGLPLHYLVASWLLGWTWGPLAIGVLTAVGAVVLCYYCAREFDVEPLLAAAGAATLAVSAQFLYTSFLALSDTVSTAWAALAFLAALRARRGRGWAATCGLAFSVAVLLRPANVILLPALVVAIWQWRGLWWAGLAAVPGAMLNGLYNWQLFGHPLVSGYGASIGDLFTAANFGPSLRNYADTLPQVLPLGCLGLVLWPWLPWRKYPRELLAAVIWVAAFVVVYALYEFTQQDWWCLRFLLPAFPGLVVLALVGIQGTVTRFGGRWRRGVMVSIGALAVVLAVFCSVRVARERHFMLLKVYQEPYREVCLWAKANLPADSLMVGMLTSASFYYYTDFPVMRWDATDPVPYTALQTALAASGRPLYAVLFPAEQAEAWKKIPGDWEPVTVVRGVGVWRLKPKPGP